MKTQTDHPVHELIAGRWSPCAFAPQPVSEEDLRSLFEAARWAPSCYDDQPWAYVVARKEDAAEFERLCACLVEANQTWARHAPVLALGLCRTHFTHNGKTNHHARHDLGLATANLSLEATARGLRVHQMAGFDPNSASAAFGIPAEWEVVTAMAIGYEGDGSNLPEAVRNRDSAPRSRKALASFVFAGSFERPAGFISGD